MAGIDNITGRILKDAQAEADGIIAKAKKKADKAGGGGRDFESRTGKGRT